MSNKLPIFVAATQHVRPLGFFHFSTAGPTAWNSLPGPLDYSNATEAVSGRLVSTFVARTLSANFADNAIYKLTLPLTMALRGPGGGGIR